MIDSFINREFIDLIDRSTIDDFFSREPKFHN